MLPRPMLRSEPSADDLRPAPPADLVRVLEQHLAADFPPDLAFDLVLNEWVVRAAEATRASAVALALISGGEMSWRAATGEHAPELWAPLDPLECFSGACIRSRKPQLCRDAESDPRIDSDTPLPVGIRSILVVPVFQERFDEGKPEEGGPHEAQPDLAGVLEVLSPEPNAFSFADQHSLEKLAREGARFLRAANHLQGEGHESDSVSADAELFHSFEYVDDPAPSEPPLPSPYRTWTIAMGVLVVLAVFGVTLLAGWRVGWLGAPRKARAAPATDEISALATVEAAPAQPQAPQKESAPPAKKARAKSPAAVADNPPPPAAGELVVYEKGKLIFRMKEPPAGSSRPSVSASSSGQRPNAGPSNAGAMSSAVVPAAANGHIASPAAVWLAPEQAEDRLLSRIEPQYPAGALASRRAGSVVLEVNVAEDGKVSSVRTLIGDPMLGAAAAEAVRNWRYQPYRAHERPAPFQTDVTLTFALPD